MRLPVEDIVGWMASVLTLITFAQTSMLPLRVTAILANVFFIAYGAMGHFLPVLTLHAILLPLNSARLIAHVGKVGAGTSMLGFRAANRVSRDSVQEDPLRPRTQPSGSIAA